MRARNGVVCAVPRIWARRLSQKLTKGVQIRIARALDIDTTTLTGYKTGNRIPNANRIIDLCLALNVSPEWLLGFVEDERQLPSGECTQERRRPCEFRCPSCSADLVVTITNGRRKAKETPDGFRAHTESDVGGES